MRRTIIVAVVVFALAASACAAGSAALGGTVRRAEALGQQAAEAVRAGDFRTAVDRARGMLTLWQAKWPVLELLTAHDALSEVRGSIEDALTCLEAGDALEGLRALGGTTAALERIRITESIRLMNLF